MKSPQILMEEKIMRVWATSDDLEDFIMQYYEGTKRMTEDQVFNVVWGIKELHDIRMEQLFDAFKRAFELDEYRPEEMKKYDDVLFNFDLTNQSGECND